MNSESLLIKCYNLYLEKYKNQSPNTLNQKKYIISSFLDSLPNLDATEINYSDIQKWEKQRNVTTNTLNGNLATIRQFLLFSKSFGINADVPIIKKYDDNYVPYLFSDNELCRLIQAADSNISSSLNASTKTVCIPMIIRILACCGTRLNETLCLKWSDYDSVNGIIVVRNTKLSKERYVPIHKSLNEMLKCYKEIFKKEYGSSEYLFPNNSLADHISISQFDYEFTKICRNIGLHIDKERYVRGICAHCLRHTFTVNSFRKATEDNTDITDTIPVLSSYLGHVRLKETEKYLKFSYDMFPNAEDAFSKYSSDIYEVLL